MRKFLFSQTSSASVAPGIILPPRRKEKGAAALPIIITVAVAITLLQVPLLYKTKSGNKFSGTQKTNITAKSLAEAGIDEIITDIGRKAVPIGATTDTTPYQNVGLGRGTYTTRVKAYQANPYRVEVTSTGNVGSNSQSIQAKMELVKTLTTIPFDTPKIALWGIRGTPPTLYYHSLDERDSGHAWIHPEGEVQIVGGGTLKIDDFTVAPNGTMYFINNVPGTNSTLYKIRPNDLDNNPATPVPARLVGPTGLIAGDTDEIRGLTFISRTTNALNGVLYAVTWQSKKVYELSLQDGSASIVSHIVPKGISSGTAFYLDAMSQDLTGAIYVVRNNAKSELWRFDEFESQPGVRQDSASYVVDISSTRNKTRALAGHPNGYLYATDDTRWYRVDPNIPRTTTLFTDSSDLKGMGFFWEREDLKFTGTPIPHKIMICHYPPGNCGNMHTIEISDNALNAHLNHGGGGCPVDVTGYCSGLGSGVVDVVDTMIQLKIISWREMQGTINSP